MASSEILPAETFEELNDIVFNVRPDNGQRKQMHGEEYDPFPVESTKASILEKMDNWKANKMVKCFVPLFDA